MSSEPLRSDKQQRLSLVVPAYNEQEVIREFHQRASAVLDGLAFASEIVYVNDGSRDGTLAILRRLADEDPRVTVIDLSRNFGKEIAMTAGLDHAGGDAVIVIDADLQDPPELIPQLVAEWRNGYEVVYARRLARDGETWLKKTSAFLFYRTMQRLARGVRIPEDTGDFRLLSRRAVEAMKQFREHNRFMKGLFAWIGFAQTAVPYRRDPRKAGATKWNYLKLWNFALEGITAFSSLPLRVASYLGVAATLAGVVIGAFALAGFALQSEESSGSLWLVALIAFVGGVQLTAIGILGEYVGRMSEETKGRPLYLINEYRPARVLVSKGREARRARDAG